MNLVPFNFENLPSYLVPTQERLQDFFQKCTHSETVNECIKWIPSLSVSITNSDDKDRPSSGQETKTKKRLHTKRFSLNGEQRAINKLVYSWYKGTEVNSKNGK
jgi:hypothetical protein